MVKAETIAKLERIEQAASDLQKSLLALSGSDQFTRDQSNAITDAMDGLSFWRRTHVSLMGQALRRGEEQEDSRRTCGKGFKP